MRITLTVSLIDPLKIVPDFRSARGRRYPLWVVLLLLILGIMSECQGYCTRNLRPSAQSGSDSSLGVAADATAV